MSHQPESKQIQTIFLVALVAYGIFYWASFQSMFAIWVSSETYAHGILILPLVLFLLWNKRSEFKKLTIHPEASGSIYIFLLSGIWFFSDLLSIDLLHQISAVLMLPALVFAILGREVLVKYRFPLFYLIFAVPMGEGLVPLLQDYTASFTVNTLSMMGFPVYIEGRFFYIPSGKFEISTACSGIRYLVASLAVGFLYAYIQFRSFKNRAIIVALSILMPIVANGIRALVIVLLVHYTDGKWGIGSDHLYYGWLFFAIVISLLILIGRRLKEPTSLHVELSTIKKAEHTEPWYFITCYVTLTLLFGPALLLAMRSHELHWEAKDIHSISTGSGWSVSAPESYDWFPHFRNAILELRVQIKKGDARTKFQSAYTSVLSKKNELDVAHVLLNDKYWHVVKNEVVTIELDTPINTSAIIRGNELLLASGGKQRLVFFYYDVSGTLLNSRFQVKLEELWQLLTGTYHYTAVHWIQVVNPPQDKSPHDLLEEVLENFDPAALVNL